MFAILLTHEQDGDMKFSANPELNQFGPFPGRDYAHAALLMRHWVQEDAKEDTWVLQMGPTRAIYARVIPIVLNEPASWGDKAFIPMRLEPISASS